MARINTILLAVIAIAVVGWVGWAFYQGHEARVAAIEMSADTLVPSSPPPLPEPGQPYKP